MSAIDDLKALCHTNFITLYIAKDIQNPCNITACYFRPTKTLIVSENITEKAIQEMLNYRERYFH